MGMIFFQPYIGHSSSVKMYVAHSKLLKSQSVIFFFNFQTVESFLRLLVNSRDELAFATAISGPLCSIDQTDFIVIKREAQCLKMPLFQVRANQKKPQKFFSKASSHRLSSLTSKS